MRHKPPSPGWKSCVGPLQPQLRAGFADFLGLLCATYFLAETSGLLLPLQAKLCSSDRHLEKVRQVAVPQRLRVQLPHWLWSWSHFPFSLICKQQVSTSAANTVLLTPDRHKGTDSQIYHNTWFSLLLLQLIFTHWSLFYIHIIFIISNLSVFIIYLLFW